MSIEPIVTGHDMSRFWRLVSVDGGRVRGTFWVDAPDKRGQRIVKAVDVTIWANDAHSWGRIVNDMTAFVNAGVVSISKHMIAEQVRDDVLDQIDAVKVAVLAAANAVTWPRKEASDDQPE